MSLNLKYVKDQSKKALIDLSKKLQSGHARRMGGAENHFAMFQRLKLYKSYYVSATFDRDIIDTQFLFRSLRNVIVKNPFLAVTSVTQEVSYQVKPRPNNFLKVLDQIKFDDLVWDLRTELKGLPDNKISENLNHRELPYEDGNLLWRLVLIDNNTLAFMTNHIVHDGTTAKNFLHDFTQEFNSKDPVFEPVDIKLKPLFHYSNDMTPNFIIPKAGEFIIDYTPPIWFYPEFLLNFLIVTKFCDQTPRLSKEVSKFHLFNISNHQISQIKARLSQNSNNGSRITLTSYIQNAWLHIGTTFPLYKNNMKLSNIILPIDIRRYFPPEVPQELYRYGMNIAGLGIHQYPVPNLQWKKIRQLDRYLKKDINSKKSVFGTGFMISEKFIKHKHLDIDFPNSSEFNYRSGTLLTNIGILGLENFGDGGGIIL
ncbi:Alcohol O-acetyltransferase 1 [Wickerhamomyces ciferrii]|uniref:Alcohol O-acetyltransferase 1 n=1 Tax=Wickerhamomyces ciferrii (strain ATCC 14091 / BCRC 22168 / CBS 111 / JCM 3599 / NBRC 0793 / NRRL Y-1031 F-60-10) TaxID=1206466 RepID=K0KUG1_WICCF|nr:Alcohol O-acetyltransferase 1 [Wickerhamomyces ciferrii]CCH46796.1 Alcohol O-acetyltransferase 1 [Wickerhamomyces ciferrii]